MSARKTLLIASALVAASLAPSAVLADPVDPAEVPGAGTPQHVAELRKVDAHELHVVAEIIAVDPLTQSVRLRAPAQVVDLRVQDPQQFKRVAVGDQVEATYTEGVAISVEPAGATR